MGKEYRPNVAAILRHADGRILVAERIQNPGAWQFPQGGIDKGESAREALQREVEEELGLSPQSYEVIATREGYTYDFPKGLRPWKNVVGQTQTYFLCEFHGSDADIRLDTKHPEFSAWKWIRPDQFDLSWMIDFKRDVYVRVFRDFFSIELKP